MSYAAAAAGRGAAGVFRACPQIYGLAGTVSIRGSR
jgi:hypothetical protein